MSATWYRDELTAMYTLIFKYHESGTIKKEVQRSPLYNTGNTYKIFT